MYLFSPGLPFMRSMQFLNLLLKLTCSRKLSELLHIGATSGVFPLPCGNMQFIKLQQLHYHSLVSVLQNCSCILRTPVESIGLEELSQSSVRECLVRRKLKH